MSWQKFDDNCPGCRPVFMDYNKDGTVGEPYPDTHPIMIGVNRAWARSNLQQRQAWHAFCCQNSRDPLVMMLVQELNEQFKHEAEIETEKAKNK